jgi:transcription elongation factor Elf1
MNLLENIKGVFNRKQNQSEKVPDAWACPKCGNNVMDNLDATNEDDSITCLDCGHNYQLPK